MTEDPAKQAWQASVEIAGGPPLEEVRKGADRLYRVVTWRNRIEYVGCAIAVVVLINGDAGDDIEDLAQRPRAAGRAPLAGHVTWVPRRSGSTLDRVPLVGSLLASRRLSRLLAPAIARADVVHAHSNGLLAELAVLMARRAGKPAVLTLYGTEIWHYAPKKFGPDLFTRAYNAASYVTFYSHRLMVKAQEFGLGRRRSRVEIAAQL